MADRATMPRGVVPASSGTPRPMNMARPGPFRAPAARGHKTFAEPQAFARWNPGVRASSPPGENVITIYDVIGEDMWGDGVTVNRIDAALRRIGNAAVEVHINSPGGDTFEGIAIANRLQQHPASVTVKVMGLAASAASIIAMAGDQVEIAPSAFMMIHNNWVGAVGDRNDMRATADWLEPFDAALVDIYAARTGGDAKQIAGWLDAETWMNGSLAVERKFADKLLNADDLEEDETTGVAAQERNDRRARAAALIAAGVKPAEAKAQAERSLGPVPDKLAADVADWSGFSAALTRRIAG